MLKRILKLSLIFIGIVALPELCLVYLVHPSDPMQDLLFAVVQGYIMLSASIFSILLVPDPRWSQAEASHASN